MIESFRGEYLFLSNFFPHPVHMRSQIYPTVEHAFQAAKTLHERDRARIRAARTPGEAKRIGRSVAIRPGWDLIRVQVMRSLLERKFVDPHLRERLMDTWPHDLVEGNTWGDRFWGKVDGVGENHLGRLLMDIRDGALWLDRGWQ